MPRPPARRGVTPLPDGRRLAWSEWGPADGAPVLFFEGAATSSYLGFGFDLLEPRGLRLIALDRPGLGRSDPKPDRTLRDMGDDVEAWLAAAGIERPAMVAFSQGAPFALASAHLARRVVIAAGSDEVAAREALAPELAPLIAQVAEDPDAAEAFFASMTAEAMHAMVVEGSPAIDRAVYVEPSFDASYREALAEGFAQGAAGYARDTRLAMSRWSLDLGAIEAPVLLLYGEHDASPVHAPDHGAAMAARLRRATRAVVPDAGGALLWTRPELALDFLTPG